MLTQEEIDAVVQSIEAKKCHLTGSQWEGGNGKDCSGEYP